MKLSFSTNGWHGYRWPDFVVFAADMGFNGIELHKVDDGVFISEDGPLNPANASRTIRGMIDLGLSIPCLNAVSDLADEGAFDESCREVLFCIETASNLNIPYVRVRALAHGGAEDQAVKRCVERLLGDAERRGVTLLLETCGAYADTARLRGILNHFASDNLGALWDLHHPYRLHGESAEATVTNLGAFIKHVHIKDSVMVNGEVSFRLVGEGTFPCRR
jgi:fatty-acyl-CoA synthase